MTIAEIRTRLREWASGKPEILNVYVFGSRARGTNRLQSDLDIAVELIEAHWDSPGADEWNWFWVDTQPEWESELAAIFPMPIDLEQLDRGSTPNVCAYVEEAGICVYLARRPLSDTRAAQ